jgi:type II secretory pathway component GspD/PulD (secretin)
MLRTTTMVFLMLVAGLAESHSQANSTTERPCVPARKGERFNVDFNNTSLLKVARLVSCAAQWNIIFRPSSLGTRKITVVAPTPVSLKELKTLFRSTLRLNGMRISKRTPYRVIEKHPDRQ